jgi:hypothetical protein
MPEIIPGSQITGSPATGNILYFDGSSYVPLSNGLAGQLLQSQGAAAPHWAGGIWSYIASGTGACDIQNIPAGYKMLRLQILTDSAANAVNMTFNADAGANYAWSNNDTTTHGEAANFIRIQSDGGAFRLFAAIDIVNIAAANKEVVAVKSRYAAGDNDGTVGGTWLNATNEISRITLTGTPVFWVLTGISV